MKITIPEVFFIYFNVENCLPALFYILINIYSSSHRISLCSINFCSSRKLPSNVFFDRGKPIKINFVKYHYKTTILYVL